MAKNDRMIKISSPDKIIYPKEKITKLEVINYYVAVANQMLPFVENRLLSVLRCHEGVKGECFFKKHPTTEKDMVKIFNDEDEEYFYVSNTAELVFQAQMGTIEFHIWGSSVPNINKPNLLILDLDPDDKLSLAKLRDAVLKVKSILDELNLETFLKTSGGKGYHIVIPLKCKDWETFNKFAKQIALLAESKWPTIFTTNIRKTERKGKIFIDYLRNSKGATCVAPYSLRARDSAPISMPISWENLNKIKPNEINIKNYKNYLNNSWKNINKISQKIK